jgi:hypothetical protein
MPIMLPIKGIKCKHTTFTLKFIVSFASFFKKQTIAKHYKPIQIKWFLSIRL